MRIGGDKDNDTIWLQKEKKCCKKTTFQNLELKRMRELSLDEPAVL